MPKDIGSIRIARLNKLIFLLLGYSEIPREELIARASYTSTRMLQRDIAYLRNEYAVNIVYDFSRHSYRCVDAGHFVLKFELTEEEATVVMVGLRLANQALPELSQSVDTLWEKLRVFISGQQLNQSPEESILRLSPQSVKNYRRVLRLLEGKKSIS